MTETAVSASSSERPAPVRVAIVEDHQLLSASLSVALSAEGYEPVVAPLEEGVPPPSFFRGVSPEVTLLDLDLGGAGSGKGVISSATVAGSKVIVVSATSDEADIGECLELGACGFVSKSAPYEELLGAVTALLSGGELTPEGERDRLVRCARQRRVAVEKALAPFHQLSHREAEILRQLMAGKSVERIASESVVSEATVRTQVRAILVKLGVRSQLEAVAMAARAGWQLTG